MPVNDIHRDLERILTFLWVIQKTNCSLNYAASCICAYNYIGICVEQEWTSYCSFMSTILLTPYFIVVIVRMLIISVTSANSFSYETYLWSLWSYFDWSISFQALSRTFRSFCNVCGVCTFRDFVLFY